MKKRHFIALCAFCLASVPLVHVHASPQGMAANAGPPEKERQTILVLGDSLSAEYGLERGEGWAALLDQRLQKEGRPYQIVNASISGDTTSGGRARLGGLLRQSRPSIVIIALGANDALRGLPLEETEKNLTAMSQSAQQSGARVLIVGVRVPPNYGARYASDFAALFEKVGRAQKVAVVPFMLQGVADDASNALLYFQSDGLHPTAQAQPIILDNNIWPVLRSMLPF